MDHKKPFRDSAKAAETELISKITHHLIIRYLCIPYQLTLTLR